MSSIKAFSQFQIAIEKNKVDQSSGALCVPVCLLDLNSFPISIQMDAGCIVGTKTFTRQITNGIRLFSVLFVYIIGFYLEQQQGDDYIKLELKTNEYRW